VWIGVLLVGVTFGLTEVRPIPAILVAQALNGILLPLVAVFLLLAVNDVRLMGEAERNGGWANGALVIVVGATIVLGVAGISKAATTAAGLPPLSEGKILLGAAVVAALVGWPVARRLQKR
jgi:Mn2+/Fe2+ NRAMP family transporter